jgi:predicted peptidase
MAMSASRSPALVFAMALAAAWLLAAGCGGKARRAPAPPPPAPAPPVHPPSPASKPRAPAPAVAPAPSEPAAETAGPFVVGVFRGPGGEELPYRLYLPPICERGCPLIVSFHSASGSGADNEKHVNGSRSIEAEFWTSPEVQGREPSFVLLPQADPALAPSWVRQWRQGAPEEPAEPLEMAISLIDDLAARLPIDPRRLYVSGYSMGGFASWIAISRYPAKFAAAVPIAGGGDASHIGGTRAAVWALHGAADRTVPVARSREMVEALRRSGVEPRYTEYPAAGHFIVRQALGEPGLLDWLFEQRTTGPD